MGNECKGNELFGIQFVLKGAIFGPGTNYENRELVN